MPSILSICSCFVHKNNFQLLLFVKATAFSLGLEDTLSQIYFSKKEKQREELIKLIGNTFQPYLTSSVQHQKVTKVCLLLLHKNSFLNYLFDLLS